MAALGRCAFIRGFPSFFDKNLGSDGGKLSGQETEMAALGRLARMSGSRRTLVIDTSPAAARLRFKSVSKNLCLVKQNVTLL
jgi:hypothetical protein